MAINFCIVQGTLLGSDGLPIAATIEVQSEAVFCDSLTDPDSVFFPTLKTYAIPITGAVSISLPRTLESAEVGFRFKITPIIAGVPVDADAEEFVAQIPDLATVDLGQLMPTVFATDRAATGALRIAREMLTNASLLPFLVTGLGFPKSVLAPPNPETNDTIWIESNTGRAFWWDYSESMWISSPLPIPPAFEVNIAGSATAQSFYSSVGNFGLRLSQISVKYEVLSGANDTSNLWELQPVLFQPGSATPANVGVMVSSISSAGYAVGTIDIKTQNLSVSYSPFNLHGFGLSCKKVGFPGNLTAAASFLVSQMRGAGT